MLAFLIACMRWQQGESTPRPLHDIAFQHASVPIAEKIVARMFWHHSCSSRSSIPRKTDRLASAVYFILSKGARDGPGCVKSSTISFFAFRTLDARAVKLKFIRVGEKRTRKASTISQPPTAGVRRSMRRFSVHHFLALLPTSATDHRYVARAWTCRSDPTRWYPVPAHGLR